MSDYGVSASASPGARWLAEMRPLFTVIISPSHLAHSMDKRTRANGNGDSREHTLKEMNKKNHVFIAGIFVTLLNFFTLLNQKLSRGKLSRAKSPK